MRDCLGNELNIGDKVVYSDGTYADLIVGQVIKITPKSCRVRGVRAAFHFAGEFETVKRSWQVAKI